MSNTFTCCPVQVGARPEIYHETLVKMGHELAALQKQVHAEVILLLLVDYLLLRLRIFHA